MALNHLNLAPATFKRFMQMTEEQKALDIQSALRYQEAVSKLHAVREELVFCQELLTWEKKEDNQKLLQRERRRVAALEADLQRDNDLYQQLLRREQDAQKLLQRERSRVAVLEADLQRDNKRYQELLAREQDAQNLQRERSRVAVTDLVAVLEADLQRDTDRHHGRDGKTLSKKPTGLKRLVRGLRNLFKRRTLTDTVPSATAVTPSASAPPLEEQPIEQPPAYSQLYPSLTHWM